MSLARGVPSRPLHDPACAPIGLAPIALATIAFALPAQDRRAPELDAAIDAIAALPTTPEDRGAAVRTLLAADFAAIAVPLVRAAEACRRRRGPAFAYSGIGPRTKEPWLETEFDVEHRIQFTLQHVWWEQSRRATGPAAMKTALAILEDPACGESRMMATVLVPQRAGAVREALPAIPDTMARLDKVARTDTLPLVRAWTCALLAQDARAPQDYVDVAFEIAGLEREPLQQSELLRRTGILAALPRLPPASRRVLLQRTFALLQRIDDGQGRGYFLALDLGAGLGIAPVSPASGPFAPDPRLPEYQGPNGLLPAFFQTTVNNALAWYDKHKDD